MYSKLKVLLLVTEFRTWRAARHLSYSAQLGIDDGLRGNCVQSVVATSQYLPQVLELYGKQSFDQIWIAGRLDLFDSVCLKRLRSLAPIRLGMLSESLVYTAEEFAASPTLKSRKQKIEVRLADLTHILTCDEQDTADFCKQGTLPAMWWPQAVPEQYISMDTTAPSRDRAVFYGAAYGIRQEWLKRPELQTLLVHPESPEAGTLYPLLFNALHLRFCPPFRWFLPNSEAALARHLSDLKGIRQRCFRQWLSALQTGYAVVNLSHFVKTYSGRVVEGMAAGRPVISWEIPGRPQNKALFEDEREILLYAADNPAHLASQIRRIRMDRALEARLVTNARRKIRSFHTWEIRVRQILDWIATGQLPRYT